MKCLQCPLQYVGQTDRSFKTIYKEHIQAATNNDNWHYASHGTINIRLEIVQVRRKVRMCLREIQHVFCC